MTGNFPLGATRATRVRRLMLLGSVVAVLAAAAVWFSASVLPPAGGYETVAIETGNPGAVGTSGQLGDESGPTSPLVIRELETITGLNDGHQFVGRRVDLRVPVSRHINDVAFWVGSGDNRLLVVLARDNRSDAARQEGEPATSVGLVPVGQQAVVSGIVQRVPYAEAMSSWGLTRADRTELMDRRIYLRADTVSPLPAEPGS